MFKSIEYNHYDNGMSYFLLEDNTFNSLHVEVYTSKFIYPHIIDYTYFSICSELVHLEYNKLKLDVVPNLFLCNLYFLKRIQDVNVTFEKMLYYQSLFFAPNGKYFNFKNIYYERLLKKWELHKNLI